MRLGHVEIGVNAEEQGDVDVDPLADQLPDGGRAGLGARDLDHQVGPVDRLPQPPGVIDRALGIHGEGWRHLQAHVAVAPAEAVVGRAEDIGRVLDVGDGDALIERLDAVAGLHDLLDPRIVGIAAADGLLEDRGVGGQALDPILVDQALQLAVLEDLAVQIVEPDGLASAFKLAERVGHRVASSWARAASRTWSTVKPKRVITAWIGAEAPNPCMAMTSPLWPT